MDKQVRMVLATHNPGKRREWVDLLDGLQLELLLPEEVGVSSQVPETGETYKANALIKARALCTATGLPALADDSGLEVDALDGAPGIRSARFRPGDDEARYVALLRAMRGVAASDRTARFRCVAALVLPSGASFTTEGVCEGVISASAVGEGGFGYDPVFYLPDQGMTMAALPMAVKNEISHRARAAQAMRPVLATALGL
jgi:XTP/dITP diphosphohydrolase